MKKYKSRYRVPSARASWWDYGSNAAYFVTICTHNRHCYFGNVVHGKMKLSAIGSIAHQCWLDIPRHFPFVKLDAFVVMPNHVHGIIAIDKMGDGKSGYGNGDVTAGNGNGDGNVDGGVRADVGANGETRAGVDGDVGADNDMDMRMGVGMGVDMRADVDTDADVDNDVDTRTDVGGMDGDTRMDVGRGMDVGAVETQNFASLPSAPVRPPSPPVRPPFSPVRPPSAPPRPPSSPSQRPELFPPSEPSRSFPPSEPFVPFLNSVPPVSFTRSEPHASYMSPISFASSSPTVPSGTSSPSPSLPHASADAMHTIPAPIAPSKPINQFGPQSMNLASIVRGFKIGVTKNARLIDPTFAWQPRYHDRIIRDEEAFQRIAEYIFNNPAKWKSDKFFR